MRPMPIKLMIHTDEIDQVDDPRMQTHELRPTNLDPQNRRSTSPKHIKPQTKTPNPKCQIHNPHNHCRIYHQITILKKKKEKKKPLQ